MFYHLSKSLKGGAVSNSATGNSVAAGARRGIGVWIHVNRNTFRMHNLKPLKPREKQNDAEICRMYAECMCTFFVFEDSLEMPGLFRPNRRKSLKFSSAHLEKPRVQYHSVFQQLANVLSIVDIVI